MAATLPHALEQRLAALVPRVRALRVARGASLCLLAAVAATSFVLLVDALVPLPASARGLFIAVWVTALGVLVWRLVVQPWQAEIPLSEVTRELAKKMPELGARLHTVVSRERPETSDAMLAALTEDAARRAKVIDLARAIPSHPAVLRVCAAILTLLGFLILTGLVPGSADRLRRVAMPWVRPPAATVRVIVTSGEPVVKRGGPVTLTAFAEKIDARAPAPESAALLFRESPGAPERRLLMPADGAGVFHVTRPEVARDFEYRVQIGAATSEWFRVTVLDAVELADGTQLDLFAPTYAKRPKRTFAELTDFEALEFSRLAAQLKFTHPAATAHFEWRAGGETKPEQFPLDLGPDRLSATGTVVLRGSGELRLVLLREADGKKLRTVTTANVRATPDKAPWFEQVSGVSARPRTVRPGARVAVALAACDDLSVSGAVLEYVLDSFDSRTETVPIPLTGGGTPRATGRLDFDLAPHAAASAKVLFRVRVTDNRNADDPKLAPQETFYPATGWSELRFDANAPPLEEQDILHQRDAFQEAAESARLAVREAADTIAAVRADAFGHTTLAPDHTIRLNTAREKLRRASTVLNDLARECALTPELRPLAAAVREIAERELRAAEDAALRAEGDQSGRTEAFAAAAKHLGDASDKLSALLARNTTFARERIDRARLGALEADQLALAGAEKDLLARQQQLLARLRAIVADSEPLRAAADGAKGEQARRLAREVVELAAQLAELDAASKRTVTDARDALVADVAREQEALAKRAARLFATLETAARLAGVSPPKFDEFRRPADLAAAGKTVEALTELEKQSQALERIAVEFDAWATDRADPKKGAKQLTLWQDDLLTRFRAATKGTEFDKLQENVKAAFRDEQKAIRTAILSLALPPDAALKAARDDAALHAGKAHDFLPQGAAADAAMGFTVDALARLAAKTPTVGERLAKALRDFDRDIRPEQDAIASAVDQAVRVHEGQPAALARRFAGLADRQRKHGLTVAALDLPGLGARRARIADLLRFAVADLQDSSPFDAQASQLLLRREFERLKFVLEGQSPADAKADELHRKLGALADTLDAHGVNLTSKLLEPSAPVVQDAQRQLERLTAPEASALLNDAKVAIQIADSAFRDGSKPDDVRRRVRAASDAVGKLSARLGAAETDLERVSRFAGNRRAAAVRAKELAEAKAPVSAPASDEALRQLGRELDELAHTRVGAAGQFHKKRVVDQYARLRLKPEPDRLVADQRALAEALDELAARMADIAELATLPASAEPPAPAEADAYLPSKALAEALRGLAKRQRTLHDQLTSFARAFADRLKPAAVNPFTDLEAKEHAIATELLQVAPEAEPASKAARAATDRLRVGDARGATEAAEVALTLLRQLANAGEGKPWAKRAADFVARQRAVLDDATKLVGASNAATAQLLARAVELAGRAAELARVLELTAKGLASTDTTAKPLLDGAALLKDAEKLLLGAGRKSGASSTVEAAKLRAEALGRLKAASARVGDAAPAASANAALGAALRAADLAMRTALDDITSGAAPENAMRTAANALATAAKSVGR